MKRLSFRLRIALLSTLVSVVLVALGAASYYLVYRQRVQAVDTEIRSLGSRHPGWLANRSNFDRFNAALEFIFGEEHKGKILLLVKDAEGKTLYVSPDWPKGLDQAGIDCTLAAGPVSAGTQTAGESRGGGGPGYGGGRGFGPGRGGGGGQVVFNKVPRFFTAITPESAWRLGIMGNDELRLVVGLSYTPVREDLDRMRNLFLLTLPLALLLVGGGGWLVAGRALQPLNNISRTAEQVTARGLDQRVPLTDEAPEIRRLIEVLNRMMDRLEASFRQATRFSADASHELKTPLAVMQAELENAIHAAAPDSSEQRLFTNLLEETQQLKRITSGLLLLAQADSGQLKLSLEEVPLSDDLAAIVEDAQILASDSRLEFSMDLQPGVTVRGDRGLLRMVLLNLVQNAVRYNQPGGSVSVQLRSVEAVVVTVCNTGPGIPPEDQPHIFDRFYRVRGSELVLKEGLGLGLSLAREIVLAHQGKLELKESRPGYTCFAMTLKAAPMALL